VVAGPLKAPQRASPAAAGADLFPAPAKPKPFRLRNRQPLEAELHQQLARILDRHLLPPAEWSTYPAGVAHLSPQQQAKYSRMGLKRGWPDILIIHGGRIYGLELKRPGGQLSKSRIGRTRRGVTRYYIGQGEMFERLKDAGMVIAVVRSLNEALLQIAEWGIPFRLSPKSTSQGDSTEPA
jgi:hypothetical protein